MDVNAIKKLSEEGVEQIFRQEHVVLSGKASITTITFLSGSGAKVEKLVHIGLPHSKESKSWR